MLHLMPKHSPVVNGYMLSDSGRQIGNQSRRPWQNSKHDGLLGSGSSPKLTGYTSGTSAPKFRSNDQINLNKSNAPYQLPRPYKVIHTVVPIFGTPK